METNDKIKAVKKTINKTKQHIKERIKSKKRAVKNIKQQPTEKSRNHPFLLSPHHGNTGYQNQQNVWHNVGKPDEVKYRGL